MRVSAIGLLSDSIRRTLKQLPWPGWLVTVSSPPMICVNSRVIVSPSPMPGRNRRASAFDPLKRFENARQIRVRYADAGIGDFELGDFAAPAQTQLNRAGDG